MLKARGIIYSCKCSWHGKRAIEIAHPREGMGNIVYNNVYSNASVLCPHVVPIRTIFVPQLKIYNDSTIHGIQHGGKNTLFSLPLSCAFCVVQLQ